VHGHEEAVIDAQFLANRDVELVIDERLDRVPRKVGIAEGRRNRTDSPTIASRAPRSAREYANLFKLNPRRAISPSYT
jgi:hypothetical protein